MLTWVKRGDVKYPCKSEEQLKLFLDSGYTIVAGRTKEEKPKTKEEKPEN